MNAAKTGLVHKYNITKADGRACDLGSYYFVLRLDAGGDPAHVKACRAAWRQYALEIRSTLPLLAEDILQQLEDLSPLNDMSIIISDLETECQNHARKLENLTELPPSIKNILTPDEHADMVKSIPLSSFVSLLSAAEPKLLEELSKPVKDLPQS